MEGLSRITTIAQNLTVRAGQFKREPGQRVLGTFLPDIPEELIHAAGLLPYCLLGDNAEEGPAGSIPNFACSLIRGAMSEALLHRLDFLDGILIPHYCDSSRAFLHIWKKNFPKLFSELLRLPMKLDSQGTKPYLMGELRRLKEALEKAFGVTISNEALSKSIRIYNEGRSYLRKIKALRVETPGFMTNYGFFSLVRTSMRSPKDKHNRILKEILDVGTESSTQGPGRGRTWSVFVSGKLAEPLDVFGLMDELGIVAADDDLAVGTRYFSYDVNEEGDPLEALAESYFHRVPSALVHGLEDRARYLVRQVREGGLTGIIFVHLKFCDPLVYDYPGIKRAFDLEGIPSLYIETDLQTSAKAQLRTKLEAFAETLGGAP